MSGPRHVPTFALGVLLLAACKGDDPEVVAPATSSEDRVAPVALDAGVVAADARAIVAAQKLTKLHFDAKQLPAKLVVKGKIVGGFHWLDHKGENWIVFSELHTSGRGKGQWGFSDQVRSIYLYASHHRVEGGELVLVRAVKDKNEGCDADLGDGFVPASFELTDLDGDDLGEVTFAYSHDRCVTDMGNYTLKMILLEDGAKHIVRGMTLLRREDVASQADNKLIADQLKEWPEPFRGHGRSVWDRHRWFG